MFEAYKVGVTLSLTNRVSSALGMIARDFMKTDLEAKNLQKTLKEIKLLGIGGMIVGGAGFMGLGVIGATVKPAKEYVHQLQLAKAAGMSQLEIANATASAWKTASDVMTSNPTENLKSIIGLRSVFGSTGDAVKFLPQMQRIQAVLDSVLHGVGGVGAKDVAFTAAKALELRGASVNPQTFSEQADFITRAIIASGGRFNPQMLLMAQKYAGIGGTGYSNDFMYGIMPTLAQELGGSSTGTGLTSLYRAVVGGRIDKKALAVWKSMGLLDSVKGVTGETAMIQAKNAGMFQSDPFQYMQYLKGELEARGINDPKAQQQMFEQLFSNRVAGRMANILAMQGPRLQKDFALTKGAGDSSAYFDLIKNDPMMVDAALSSQWTSFKTALGITVVPIILPMLRGLTSAISSLGQTAAAYPTATTWLVGTLTAVSGLAAIGGTLAVASAALKLTGIALSTLTGLPLIAAATGLTGIATAITVLLAAIAPIIYHKEIADWIDKRAPGVGDALLGFGSGKTGSYAYGKTGFAPPSGTGKQPIHTTIEVDGRRLASAVNTHNARDASRTSGSGGPADYRSLPRHPGAATGSW